MNVKHKTKQKSSDRLSEGVRSDFRLQSQHHDAGRKRANNSTGNDSSPESFH